MARLEVKVPADSTVYLQGQRMTLTGPVRRYYSPRLRRGVNYIYTVKVEVARQATVLSKTTKAKVQAGQRIEVAVDFDRDNPNSLVASVRPLTRR